MITYDEFVANHNGKALDYDGCAGVQCVDLAKYYLDEVFDIKPGAWGDAHDYYDGYGSRPELVKNFTRIANTPDFAPQKGDICIWKSSLSKGGWGHIAIATGEGNTKYFYSYDQNWTGNHDKCAKIKHNYNHFAGVLRPKDQSRITGATFKAGVNYTLTVNLKVRSGAGTDKPQKKRSALTADGQKHSLTQTYACLKSGTVVTVQEVKTIGSDIWGRIPSGWIALRYGGKKYVK